MNHALNQTEQILRFASFSLSPSFSLFFKLMSWLILFAPRHLQSFEISFRNSPLCLLDNIYNGCAISFKCTVVCLLVWVLHMPETCLGLLNLNHLYLYILEYLIVSFFNRFLVRIYSEFEVLHALHNAEYMFVRRLQKKNWDETSRLPKIKTRIRCNHYNGMEWNIMG